jgi:hypothetical protein
MRTVGPDTDSAPIASPCPLKTGAPAHRMPSAFS